ncbi:ParA family protein [Algoriphagus persicinus]|uniref:ParA family protein n=1 Tax=Algoriphagus persicinus TaxID=3108754 RepID=UPI002B3BF749|nr:MULTISPECIES: ParA family protein [unclassified Algoriphagus]MEB2780796.1 ParA family protein [Algoriphagus sp. C2-6-M1]MEB2786547.1 ParA family protein [Algoriphagus sp. E1-3-M2]
MIILFANQKGGVGKSTLAVLFSNFAAQKRKRKVKVFDMDFQQSLYNKYLNSDQLENEKLYEVELSNITGFKSIQKRSKNDPLQLTVIDLAGKMDDDNLVQVFKESELIICPFCYDEYSVTSTFEFCYVVKKLNPASRIILIPNRVKSSVKYETLESVNQALGQFGELTSPVTDRIDFQRLTTSYTPESLVPILDPIFNKIFDDYIKEESSWETETT